MKVKHQKCTSGSTVKKSPGLEGPRHLQDTVGRIMQAKFPNINVYTDDWVLDEVERIKADEKCEESLDDLCDVDYAPNIFVNSGEDVRKSIDFIVTLGGDGTILWASKQFSRCYFPPLISFAHGSLGHMCNFEFKEHE